MPKPNRDIRAAIYCRISLAAMGDTRSVEDQEEIGREICDQRGWQVSKVYSDNNRSAWRRNRKRPGWDALLAAIEAGEVDAIVIYHGDRFIRQPWDLEQLLSIADQLGILLVGAVGEMRLDDPDHRMMLRFQVAKACNEVDTISRRVRDKTRIRARRGQITVGGLRPYGFEPDRATLIPDETAVLREAGRLVLAGDSLRSIVRGLRAAGILTSTDSQWTITALKVALLRPRNAGLSVYRGEIVGEYDWPETIFGRETWEALRLRLERPAQLGRQPRYELSGIATCGPCGGPMTATAVSRHHRVYRCVADACEKPVTRGVDALEAYVDAAVVARLADPRLAERLRQPPRRLRAEAEALRALEVRRRDSVAAFSRPGSPVSPVELEGILADLDQQITAVRRRIDAASERSELTDALGLDMERWRALPLDQRRAVIRRLVTVTVWPVRVRGSKLFEIETVDVKRRRGA